VQLLQVRPAREVVGQLRGEPEVEAVPHVEHGEGRDLQALDLVAVLPVALGGEAQRFAERELGGDLDLRRSVLLVAPGDVLGTDEVRGPLPLELALSLLEKRSRVLGRPVAVPRRGAGREGGQDQRQEHGSVRVHGTGESNSPGRGHMAEFASRRVRPPALLGAPPAGG
jgi:hypothetical protein